MVTFTVTSVQLHTYVQSQNIPGTEGYSEVMNQVTLSVK